MSYSGTIDELVRRVADREASRIAIRWRDQAISYLNLDTRIDCAACGLLRLGVKPGDRIALYLHNVPQYIESYLAILRTGAIAVPVNVFYKGKDLAYLLADSGAVGVITVTPLYRHLEQIRSLAHRLKWVVNVTGKSPQPPGTISWETLNEELLPERFEPCSESSDYALLAYSAGTGGLPRGALYSHTDLIYNCLQFLSMSQIDFGKNTAEVVLLPIPLTDLFALNTALTSTLLVAGTLILMERFDPTSSLAQIEKYSCTTLFATPTIYRYLVYHPSFPDTSLDSLQYAFSYGEPLPEKVQSLFTGQTKLPVIECYGLVEAGPVVASTAASPEFKPGTVGHPLPGVSLKLVDFDGLEVPDGTAGEVVIQGKNMMHGYFKLDKFEKELLEGKKDGGRKLLEQSCWLKTGDMGWIDPEGNLNIIDRRENVIIIANEIIFPREIEEVLRAHPALVEAAVIAGNGRKQDTMILAYVIRERNRQGVEEKHLREYLSKIVPPSHIPGKIVFVDSLPRFAGGRVMQRALNPGLE